MMSQVLKKPLPKFAWVLMSLYAGLGIVLFMLVPKLDQIHNVWYSDWQTNTNPLVQLYHFPSVIWLGISGVFTGLIYWINVANFSLKMQKTVNLGLIIFWVILFIHVVDWLGMFNFCHEWGCSRMLPTWRWFGL